MIEYSNFIDGGYSLSNFFKSTVSLSPLQLPFLQKINRLWNMVTFLATKVMQSPRYLWKIRLNIAINLIEEQYLLLCLLTHLIFAFKMVCQKFNSDVPSNIKDFINRFEHNFETNLKFFTTYISTLSTQIPEFAHLQKKLP